MTEYHGRNKGIGFNRILKASWLDFTAELTQETDSQEILRTRLHEKLADSISFESRDRTIDVLLRTWVRTRESYSDLNDEARLLFSRVEIASDRIWLHWGLLLLAYPIFRESVEDIGRAARLGRPVENATLTRSLMARRGEVASLTVVVGRVLALLKNWDLVEPGPARASYSAKASSIPAATLEIQTWLLACALTAHPAHELPIPDLISLPELFPFSINPGSADIRASKWFEVNRYGAGWEMVKLRPALSPSPD